MALIIDPDFLNDAATSGVSEVFIDTAAKTIKLTETGNLSSDGATLKAVYSMLKEEWKNDPFGKNLPAFPFPMVPITDESFEFIDGWDFADDASRFLIRTAGWTVRNTAGAATQIWSGIIGLGNIQEDDQIYYYQGPSSPGIVPFQLTGQVNQAIQVMRDDNGDGTPDFDYRDYFEMFVREAGQTYASASIDDIGVSFMANIAYRFPLSTGDDLNIGVPDTDIDTDGTGYPPDKPPYAGMSISYYSTDQTISGLSGGDQQFGVIIDGNGQRLSKVYEFVQYALRQNENINAIEGCEVIGTTADQLLYWVGDVLHTNFVNNPCGGCGGVFITNFDATDQNNVVFTACDGNPHTYPYVAVLVLNFNDNLVNDPDAEYWVYYTNTPSGANWGQTDAIIVEDADSAQMVGAVTASQISRTYDYDSNTQGGRVPAAPPGGDVNVTGISLGLETGQYVRASLVGMTRSKQNALSLVAPLERNYDNP